MTFAELDAKSNRIAWTLIDRRGPDRQAVAVLSDLASQMIPSILAVLKTGNFFVPIDPTLPMQRQQFIVSDCQANLILTTNANADRANQILGPDGIVVSSEGELDSRTHRPAIAIQPDDLTWIIYTSSTPANPRVSCSHIETSFTM